MPRAVFLKIYQSKGNSDTTAAAVIPKKLRKTIKLKNGDELQAKVDEQNGLLIYRRK